ncbi:hypothetical protein SBA4_4710020 [Candidatus Sulfopaludibacter sp. SbA4]|nr:hypothetical protein SBA4_4710020 [Candidatus Sulfopaludibacter sp. SbA4]
MDDVIDLRQIAGAVESDPMLFFLTVDPVFDALRRHDRFAKLLRAMNLQPF